MREEIIRVGKDIFLYNWNWEQHKKQGRGGGHKVGLIEESYGER